MPFKTQIRRAVLALVLPFLSTLPDGAEAYDQHSLYTQVSGWSIVSHTYSGQFGGCSAWTEQPGGFQLHLVNDGWDWKVGTTFSQADQINGGIGIDGQRWTTTFFYNGDLMLSRLKGQIIDAAAAGHRMRLQIGGNALDFSLAGSRDAINAVHACLGQTR